MGQSWWSYDRRFYKETASRGANRIDHSQACIAISHAHSLSPLHLITELIADMGAVCFDAALAEELFERKREGEAERESVRGSLKRAIITINERLHYLLLFHLASLFLFFCSSLSPLTREPLNLLTVARANSSSHLSSHSIIIYTIISS